MKVLEALDYYLVVFHPYRSLSEYVHSSLLSAFQKCLPYCLRLQTEEMIRSVNDDTCKTLQSSHSMLLMFFIISCKILDQFYIPW